MIPSYDELFNHVTILQASTNELLARFQDLSTFVETYQWDADARALIVLLEQEKQELMEFKAREQQSLKLARDERESKPFLKRIFASKRTENKHETNSREMDQAYASINTTIDNILEQIDITPNSISEQKAMLKELGLRKKELALEKRSENESVRLINLEAQRSMSNITEDSGGIFGSSARDQRNKIRQQKESELRPHEDAKSSLTRQTIDLEKKILWVSRFKGYEIQTDVKVLRCAYCGRRVTAGIPCPGCGSNRTTIELS
jgi:hypothetical protein